jgi:hypothetical protein
LISVPNIALSDEIRKSLFQEEILVSLTTSIRSNPDRRNKLPFNISLFSLPVLDFESVFGLFG